MQSWDELNQVSLQSTCLCMFAASGSCAGCSLNATGRNPPLTWVRLEQPGVGHGEEFLTFSSLPGIYFFPVLIQPLLGSLHLNMFVQNLHPCRPSLFLSHFSFLPSKLSYWSFKTRLWAQLTLLPLGWRIGGPGWANCPLASECLMSPFLRTKQWPTMEKCYFKVVQNFARYRKKEN